MYAQGKGVPQDYAKAAEWYRKAAEQGVAAAQYNLGVIYANGQGVPQNITEARKWFEKAAEQDVGLAEDSLGTFFGSGQGQPKDYAEAQKWYRKAAEKGIASAQFNLAVMYDLGQGVERNYAEALKWYRMAADQGYASAMTNIGILYYNAQGVPRDLVEAYAWFSRAAKAGDERGAQLLRITESRMKPGDVKKGQEVAANWKPKPPTRTEEVENLFLKPATPTPTLVASADRTAPAAPAQPKPAPSRELAKIPARRYEWTGVERIVAVGDVHGDFEQFVRVLESASLIDGNGNWVGGKTHLVQTGDIVDRGPDSRKVMDLLMKLEKQADAAGGAVHCLIGNHEAMDVYGDYRYVSPAEFGAFRTETSEAARDFSYQRAKADLAAAARPEADRAKWNSENPPGMAEHRAALSPTGPYGSWIAGHNAAVKIDDNLFVHAGISEKYANWTLDQLNREVRDELTHMEKLHGGVVTDEEGPLWYHALAKGDESQLQPLVDKLVRHFGVSRIVIGHSYANAAITPRFGGKVILVDIGLSRIYDNIGKLGCLLIENGKPYALHRGQKLELPKDEGPDMLRYLKQAAALDPQPSPLAKRIEALEAKAGTAALK